MSDLDILNGNDDFPYPISINRTDFKSFNQAEIDEFLYKNHRFTSIDLLIKELTKLSKDLNQNLLDLVNNDYNDFIRLGKSINGGLDLINLVSGDLKSFKLDLVNHYKRFEESQEMLDNALNRRQQLIHVKTLAKLNIVLNDQVTNFENALMLDSNEVSKDVDVVISKVKSLTGMYLSIAHLYQFVSSHTNVAKNSDLDSEKSDNNKLNQKKSNLNGNGNSDTSSLFIHNYLHHKISSIKFEFKSYLEQIVKLQLNNRGEKNNSNLILELLNVYKVIGHESELIALLKRR
ncbi:hypothetical protein DFJ63DRAFT_315219 [Scheffersomyces coipomensis]|uniref:uncharacterized protein n=1 Tax=Scheffersomyces coipomensis TaxID=1788519 RepID=UPI00315DE78B